MEDRHGRSRRLGIALALLGLLAGAGEAAAQPAAAACGARDRGLAVNQR